MARRNLRMPPGGFPKPPRDPRIVRVTPKPPNLINRTLEAEFSNKLRKAMRFLGVRSVKTNDRTTRGIPDIYFIGGNWIESKVVPGLPIAHNPPLKYYNSLQKSFLDTFQEHGDSCFAAVLWEMDRNQRIFLLMPWWEFRRVRYWDLETATHFGKGICETWEFALERFFKDGEWDPTLWWNQTWASWPHKTNPRRFNAAKQVEKTLDELVKEAEDEDD